MAYQVLARKWRPHNFPNMVGQAHVLQALTNALTNNRLHHAYLFTGTRGVGKTTVARILAKSLNCETGVTAHPCGQCLTCKEIDAGHYVDLIEVDAASRTKVEDTRDLLDNVQYAPTRGRYKVYLIDEVHMLSAHSFNALLKTLEEPPNHVKFLLATTDPQKLPPTILSRCLQFNLKRLNLEQIVQHLTKILNEESISYENQALPLLAQAADGSLRDALSLLDQAIAYGSGNLTSLNVANMLGTLDQKTVLELVKALASNDAVAVLQQVAILASQNPDFSSILSDISSILQQVAIAQVVPNSVGKDQLCGETLAELAQQMLPEDVQLFYQIGLLGRRDLPLAPEPRGGFEMIMLRMLTFRPAGKTTLETSQRTSSPSATLATQPSPSPTAMKSSDKWGNIVQSLGLSGLARQLALNCQLKQQEGDIWHLILSPTNKLLLTEERKKQIETKLRQQHSNLQSLQIQVGPEAKTPVKEQRRIQEVQQQYAANAVDKDPFVMYMKENCEARINKIQLLTE